MLRFVVVAAFLTTSTPAWAVKVGQKVPNFQLKDSNGKDYTLQSFKKKVIIFWYEGKNSKEQNRPLKVQLKKIYDTNGSRIQSSMWRSVGIANFQETAVPNFIINLVIKSEIKKTGAVILCDRTGEMMKKWGFRNGRSNIYMLDKNRRLRWKTSGPMGKKAGKRFIRLLRRLTRE
ncbi:MAG: redoxin domain-containing protein [bacterium]